MSSLSVPPVLCWDMRPEGYHPGKGELDQLPASRTVLESDRRYQDFSGNPGQGGSVPRLKPKGGPQGQGCAKPVLLEPLGPCDVSRWRLAALPFLRCLLAPSASPGSACLFCRHGIPQSSPQSIPAPGRWTTRPGWNHGLFSPFVSKDKKYASDKYKDIYTELSIVRAKADCDVSRLKEQLKAATEALGEKSPESTPVSGYGEPLSSGL